MLLPQDEELVQRRPRGRPKAEEVAAIESRLLDVAFHEFVARGYGGTSLTSIVKAAGISKTTLYTRYASKEALFRAIMQRQIDGFAAAAALRPTPGAPDLVAGLDAYGNRTLEISLEGALLQVNRLIYSESGRFPELGQAAAEFTQRGIGDVANFIGTCAEADGTPCRDPRAVAETFIYTLRGWYVEALLTNTAVTARMRQHRVASTVRTLIAGRAEW